MRVLILFCFILVLILSIRYVWYFQTVKSYSVGDSVKQQVTLLSEPKISSFYQTFKLDSLSIQAPVYPEYHYGDTLEIEGTVEDGSFQAENGKIVSRLVVKNPKIIAQKSNIFISSAAYLRRKIENTFNAYLPKNEAALLFGIVFGGTQGFDKNTQDAFRNSGVLHVVAASGMNVSMVAGFLVFSLSRFFKRQKALLIAVIGVFYYALLSGFSASIMRASIMAAVVFTAEILGRKNYAVLTLFLTAFVMLMVSPGILFDAGFLLSFTATLGIITIKPLFDQIKIIEKTKAFSDDITTSVSAQLGSIPVMAGVFGTYSAVSILTNALVLWTIPFLMILGGVAALCAITIPFVSVIFLYLCYPLLTYFERIILLFGSIPMLEVGDIPWLLPAGYYLILFSTILFIQNKAKK